VAKSPRSQPKMPLGAHAGMSLDASQADGRWKLKRYDSCHPSTTFLSQNKNMRSGSGVNQWIIPHAYWEDTGKKDQVRALLDRGSAPPKLDEYNPVIMAVATLMASEDGRTCKAPSELSPSPPVEHSSLASQEIPV
jgi:hypothetical protein